MTNAIDTVIFDLDGTLVDSQPAALGGTIEALSRFGVQVTATDLRKVFGGGAWKLVGHFLERDLGSDRARDLLEAVQLRSSLQLELTNEVVLLPDVKGLLASLKDSGHKLAIATMSSRVVAERVLGYHGIISYFDSVLAIDDVKQGKPDPEILQKTVDCLGGQVRNTIYAGDSSHDPTARNHTSHEPRPTSLRPHGKRRPRPHHGIRQFSRVHGMHRPARGRRHHSTNAMVAVLGYRRSATPTSPGTRHRVSRRPQRNGRRNVGSSD